MILRLAVLTTVLCAAPAWSATISWDCNTESDMKEYRVEYSADGGGFKTTAPAGPLPWDEQAPWWVTIKARLTDKRRTG